MDNKNDLQQTIRDVLQRKPERKLAERICKIEGWQR